METYNVKQIAEMLNTQPETVRRWIRSGKLQAEKTSRKDGNVVTKESLNQFLKKAPKYAGLATAVATGTALLPFVTPLVGGAIAATYYSAFQKARDTKKENSSRGDEKKMLLQEINKLTQSINQKREDVERMQREIEYEQQLIMWYEFLLKKEEE